MHPWTDVVAAYDDSLDDLEAAREVYLSACLAIRSKGETAIDLADLREQGRPDLDVGEWATQDDGGTRRQSVLVLSGAGGMVKTTLFLRPGRPFGQPAGSFQVGTRNEDNAQYRAWLGLRAAGPSVRAQGETATVSDVTRDLDNLMGVVRSVTSAALEDLKDRVLATNPLSRCLAAIRACEEQLKKDAFADVQRSNWQGATYLQCSAGRLNIWVCPQLDQRRLVYVHHRGVTDGESERLAAETSAGESFKYGEYPARVLIDADTLADMDEKTIAQRCLAVFRSFRRNRGEVSIS